MPMVFCFILHLPIGTTADIRFIFDYIHFVFTFLKSKFFYIGCLMLIG